MHAVPNVDPSSNELRVVAVSVSASRDKWKQLSENENESEKRITNTAYLDSALILYNNYLTRLQLEPLDWGAIHNAAIMRMFIMDVDYTSPTELVDSVLKVMREIGPYRPTKSDRAYIIQKFEHYRDSVYSDNHLTLHNNLVNLYPNRIDELNVIYNYFNTASNYNVYSTIYQFTEGYYDIIDESNLDGLVKSRLKSTISICPASYKLWNDIENLTD